VIPALLRAAADDGAEGHASRITGDESLWEKNEPGTPGNCLGGQLPNLGERGAAIEDHRRGLYDRDPAHLCTLRTGQGVMDHLRAVPSPEPALLFSPSCPPPAEP